MPKKKVEPEKPKKKPAKKVLKPGSIDGRPASYTPELGQRICDLIATNTCSLLTLCNTYDDLPVQATINSWRWKFPDFLAEYRKAKEAQAQLLVEQCEEIAQEKYFYIDVQGNKRIDSGYVAHQKLVIDTKRWHASKLAPKIYGDKVELDQLRGQSDEMMQELLALRAELNAKNKKDF